ncbi:amidotransferase [Tsuneonella dongtanensis]|uniref:Amidotransferase n=1 Tax=Tsuneonella dongtanensis TaxID=692370 RepID=A0A1B2AB35_9SPHN|nr:hypothetical protein [Tsuneonella dongtanensis]ANY19377.1 amidotransferase [Tsuneonella dongtanensis]
MKLGILKAGDSPAELAAAHGSYPDMFRAFLGHRAFDYVEYDVRSGTLPLSVDDCPAYLVTGSAADAYATDPWIVALKQFLRDAAGEARLLGVCFGHQVMAEAFGGKVAQSEKGWGLGAQTYEVAVPHPALQGATRFTLPLSHRDQVMTAPPGATTIAGNAFTPFGMLAYSGHPSLSLQPHPEFTRDFAAALVERRRGNGIDEASADASLASLDDTLDCDRAAVWLGDFLLGAPVIPS